MVSEEDQYKSILSLDITLYNNVNFNTYIKEANLIKDVIIKNSVPENTSFVKTLDDLMKDILQDKKKQNDPDLYKDTKFLKKFMAEIDQLWVYYQTFGMQLSKTDYPRRIQRRLAWKKFILLESGGRLVVSKQQGPIKMKNLPKSISTSLPEGMPKVDLFVSRLSHQLPQYVA